VFSCYLWQFAHWLDGVLLVFSLDNELSFSDVYTNYTCLCRFRDMREIPIVIVGTQDAISEKSPRAVDDNRIHQLATQLHNCSFHETCAMYGLNIERVFYDGRWLAVVIFHCIPSVLSHCWLGNGKGVQPIKASTSEPLGILSWQ